MKKEKPLVNQEYLLQKFPGKGGWTYAAISEVLQNKNTPFGWVKVRGSIDGYTLNQHKLMPMGNGQLFLPVKAAIRKKINKTNGDYVKVILYADHSSFEIPDEILECFKNEPEQLLTTFHSFAEGSQKAYIDWIYNAKTDETKAIRILKMMDRLSKGLKFHVPEN
ncbi:YdeI/OmpD-associated family protein [Flagellimonas sp. CMM7]|uniref:YdeI/OmpD-associated family protein n=1 Tax=Flagellimonas sp. CMM7 TaxID=2654676 RepID=UPI0013CF5689|nr:YdeI/OmpD-associated family protein [Flagellimonas sp. CMM7]UII79163.1 YdeI/OmpD-associated family protein [Flagellimonas sp. CMM7]